MIKIGKYVPDISFYSCQPKTRVELYSIIEDRISKEGPNCDLNDIDTSLITNMGWMFYESDFNGDISRWDVSNVEDMSYMFYRSRFNQDISKWKINKDCDNYHMFYKSLIKEEYKPKSLQQP